jgi:hypothetical protein
LFHFERLFVLIRLAHELASTQEEKQALTCLLADTQPEPPVSHAVPSHRRLHNRWQLFSAVRPGQCDEERLAMQQRVFSNGDHPVLARVAEKKMYQAGYCSGVCRRGDHFYLGKALRGGCVPGATDGSMPVGSALVFIDKSVNIYTFIYFYLKAITLNTFACPLEWIVSLLSLYSRVST